MKMIRAATSNAVASSSISSGPVLLERVGSSALKLFSAALECLPVSHRYNIVFMMRSLEQVLDSQKAFVGRHPRFRARFLSAHMSAESQREVRDRMLSRLPRWPQVNLLTVHHPALVADPQGHAEQLAAFLGRERLPHAERMAAVIDAGLYRNRLAALSWATRDD